MRNIANVVHDLSPIQESIQEKFLILKEITSPEDYLQIIDNIEVDLALFETYLMALKTEAFDNKLVKAIHPST